MVTQYLLRTGADRPIMESMTTTTNGSNMTTTNHPIAAGPETPGAIVTHAGNYIVPASTDGTMTCDTCAHTMPVTKFPTRPATPDGIVTRVPRCRACRDALVHARRGAPSPVANRGTIVPTPNGPRYVPSAGSAPVAPIDRMAARWDNHTPGTVPDGVMLAAVATMAAMGESTGTAAWSVCNDADLADSAVA